MIIEFADPGLNGILFLWLAVAFTVGIVLFFLPFFLTKREGLWPMPGFILSLVAFVLVLAVPPADYYSRVDDLTVESLEDAGFSDVDESGGRFTAATEDGQYFRGVLVDLEPESGYAYQVLELTGTEK